MIWISYIIFSISTFSIYLQSHYTVTSNISIIYKYKVIPQPMWDRGRTITICVGQHYIAQTTYVKNNVTWMWPVRDPSPPHNLIYIHFWTLNKFTHSLVVWYCKLPWPLSWVTTCLSACIFNFQHSASFSPQHI